MDRIGAILQTLRPANRPVTLHSISIFACIVSALNRQPLPLYLLQPPPLPLRHRNARTIIDRVQAGAQLVSTSKCAKCACAQMSHLFLQICGPLLSFTLNKPRRLETVNKLIYSRIRLRQIVRKWIKNARSIVLKISTNMAAKFAAAHRIRCRANRRNPPKEFHFDPRGVRIISISTYDFLYIFFVSFVFHFQQRRGK